MHEPMRKSGWHARALQAPGIAMSIATAFLQCKPAFDAGVVTTS
jgi:hypothetical protein